MSTKRNSKNQSPPPDTSEFDQEFVADTFHPLSPDEKKRWQKVRASLSQLKNGKKRGNISIRVEENLLARVDTLAKKLGMSRDSLITRGIKAVLAANDDI